MKQISCYSLSATIGGNPQAEVIIGVSLHKVRFYPAYHKVAPKANEQREGVLKNVGACQKLLCIAG